MQVSHIANRSLTSEPPGKPTMPHMHIEMYVCDGNSSSTYICGVSVDKLQHGSGFPGSSGVKNSAAKWRLHPILCREDPLAKEMATHSSILAWEISWTEQPGRLQSMELQTIGHN